jgi:hypothetical protein
MGNWPRGDVTNIYDETPERARQFGRAVDTQAAEAVDSIPGDDLALAVVDIRQPG